MKGIALIVMLISLLIVGYLMLKRTGDSSAAPGKTMIDMPNKAREQLDKSMEMEQKRIDEMQKSME